MPSSLLSHVPAKELWPVWSLPPRPKCFNQARILNEWRPRVCWREEKEGRQFLEMITDSFPCLSCLWKRETPTPPTPLALHSTPPPHELLQDLSLPLLYFSMIVAPLLNIWPTRSSLPLLLFMSGAQPPLALVFFKWGSRLSLKLMAGNLQLTSPTAVSSASFYTSPFLPFPPCCLLSFLDQSKEGWRPGLCLLIKQPLQDKFSKKFAFSIDKWQEAGSGGVLQVGLFFSLSLVEK